MSEYKDTMHLVVTTPNGVVYENDAREVTLETESGQITVLHHHTPLVSVLKPGEMIVRKGKDEEHHFALSGGILEVREGGAVVILADAGERAEDIDLEKAEKARARVEEALKEKETLDEVAIARFEAELANELLRLRVGGRNKNI